MDFSFTHTVCDDPVDDEAHRRGFTPDLLPALRKYHRMRASGDGETAERIAENLMDFFREHPPLSDEAAE